MPVDRRFRLARIWSNEQLRRLAPLCSGDVVNVSAGDDVDKEGGIYRDYFTNCTAYALTNYKPGSWRGFRGRDGEYQLDLTGEVPPSMVQKFDVVFNHTTLEHIFDVRRAFANLCRLSRDLVIVVVPFAQVQHERHGDYGDYWRFTPTCLRELFKENDLSVVYEAEGPEPNAASYVLAVGSRHPERWRARLPSFVPIERAGDWIGAPRRKSLLSHIRALASQVRRKCSRKLGMLRARSDPYPPDSTRWV